MCPKGWLLDTDWKTCVDIDECKEQEALKPEERCNYECINTPGSYKCTDYEVGADQPIYYDHNNDFIKLDLEDEKTKDESSDMGGEASEVSICLNGFYYNETIGDCMGKLIKIKIDFWKHQKFNLKSIQRFSNYQCYFHFWEKLVPSGSKFN